MTSGGDCPGLNAAIRAVVRRALKIYRFKVIGFRKAWEGLLEGDYFEMDYPHVSGILHLGGTILHTTRKNLLEKPGNLERCVEKLEELGLDGLVILGGDGSAYWALELHKLWPRVVLIPKTIDNDVWGTKYSIGFDTAINVATEALDRLHTTAESHDRVFVVNVMGRATGWVALMAGMAGGADVIVIPEFPLPEDAVLRYIDSRRKRGKTFSIVVVAEGVHYLKQKEGESVSMYLARIIEEGLGITSRTVKLDYVLRGGSPTAFDRLLATRMGSAAVDLLARYEFGNMTALVGDEIVPVPLGEVVGRVKRVSDELWRMAKVFFG